MTRDAPTGSTRSLRVSQQPSNGYRSISLDHRGNASVARVTRSTLDYEGCGFFVLTCVRLPKRCADGVCPGAVGLGLSGKVMLQLTDRCRAHVRYTRWVPCLLPDRRLQRRWWPGACRASRVTRWNDRSSPVAYAPRIASDSAMWCSRWMRVVATRGSVRGPSLNGPHRGSVGLYVARCWIHVSRERGKHPLSPGSISEFDGNRLLPCSLRLMEHRPLIRGGGAPTCHALHVLARGGAEGIRTPDLLSAIQARSQLRHSPKRPPVYGAVGRVSNERVTEAAAVRDFLMPALRARL